MLNVTSLNLPPVIEALQNHLANMHPYEFSFVCNVVHAGKGDDFLDEFLTKAKG